MREECHHKFIHASRDPGLLGSKRIVDYRWSGLLKSPLFLLGSHRDTFKQHLVLQSCQTASKRESEIGDKLRACLVGSRNTKLGISMARRYTHVARISNMTSR